MNENLCLHCSSIKNLIISNFLCNRSKLKPQEMVQWSMTFANYLKYFNNLETFDFSQNLLENSCSKIFFAGLSNSALTLKNLDLSYCSTYLDTANYITELENNIHIFKNLERLKLTFHEDYDPSNLFQKICSNLRNLKELNLHSSSSGTCYKDLSNNVHKLVNLEKLILGNEYIDERDAFKLIKEVKEYCPNIIYFHFLPGADNVVDFFYRNFGFATKDSNFRCGEKKNNIYDRFHLKN